MIISASRRTDIPAFFSNWFQNRIREGFVMTRNPFNYKQVSKISLSPDQVEGIVFWTKNPGPMLKKLEYLHKFSYYFLYTLTPYDKEIETNLPSKEDLIATFIALSRKIGPKRVIWRYDPILLTDNIDIAYHLQNFEYLASRLSGYTSTCIFSFLEMYQKTIINMKEINIHLPEDGEKLELIKGLIKIAERYNINMQTCAEHIDLSDFGVIHGSCINSVLISDITGEALTIPRDKNQRKECRCCESIDIGTYNTCRNNCLYCYANYNKGTVEKNFHLHDKNSPLLIGNLTNADTVTKKNNIGIDDQLKLF